jgi:large subunit ribosomal protein L14
MIQLRTVLKPADNSGAKKLVVMGIPGRIGKIAHLGKVVKCVVHGAESTGNVADREKVNVVIVRCAKETRRPDGTYIKFDDNAGVVIDKQGLPKGTRILGPVAREVKEAGYTKIASLAREVV